jgi:hypothetical protein
MWEERLPHVEFAYNCSLHSTIKMFPFEIVYGLLPRAPIDLMPLPSSEKLNFDAKQCDELMLKMHETTKQNIKRMNAKYKISGALVAGLSCSTRSRRPRELVYRSLRCSVPGRL